MKAVPRRLLEYVAQDGRVPFREWLEGLRDVEGRARVRVRLNRLRLGNFGDVKAVGKGVSELRVSFGAGYRVYFARIPDALVLLLCGGDKSSQKRDIRLAKDYWRDFQRRST